MEQIKINSQYYNITDIRESPPLLIIIFEDITNIENIKISSMELYTSGGAKCRDLNLYNTIYKTNENTIIFSNDNSVYIEPEPIVVYTPTEEELQLIETKSQIANLKSQLENTDYKIIKCSEYQLMGLEIPYDIAVLHNERQALRDQINALEISIV
jgi:hypothetical protein